MSLVLVRTWKLPFPTVQVWEALSQPAVLTRWWLPLEEFEPTPLGRCRLQPGAAPSTVTAHVVRWEPESGWTLSAEDGSWSWDFQLRPQPKVLSGAAAESDLEPQEHATLESTSDAAQDTELRCTLTVHQPGAEVWADSWQALSLLQLRRQLDETLHVPIMMDFLRTHEPLIWLGIRVDAPARACWQALTESLKFNLFSGIELKLRLEEGARMLLRWPPRSGPEVEPGTVIGFKKDRVLVFRLPSPQLGASQVTWSLMPSEGALDLELLHEGYPAGMETLGWRMRWLAFLVRVQSFVEAGIQLPSAERG